MTNTIVPRLTVRIPIFCPSIDCNSSVNKTALAQVASIPRKTRTDRNIAAIVRPNKMIAVRLEVSKIVRQAPPKHLRHVGRTGDVNSKILLVERMHNSLETHDRLFGALAFHEHDHIAGLAVFGDQQPAPERAGQRVLKTLRAPRSSS
jgi:hypothetical protein